MTNPQIMATREPAEVLETLAPGLIDSTLGEALQQATEKHQTGDIDGAETIYRKILEVQPNNAKALHNLGLVALQRGLTNRAVKRIRQAIAIDGSNFTYHNSLGYALAARKDFTGAEFHYRQAIDLEPTNPESYSNFANMLAQQGKWDDAITNYRLSLNSEAGYLAAIMGIGKVLIGLSRFEEAETVYTQGLTHHPNHDILLNNLGGTLFQQGKTDGAITAYQQLIEAHPEYPDARRNLAVTMDKCGRLDEAAAICREELEKHPDDPAMLDALANTLMKLRQTDEALQAYDRGLEIDPNNANIHGHRALALLLTGDFENGWKEYEWRWKAPGFTSPIQNIPRPLWDGAPLEGRTILLHAEQGAGDTFQFARYVSMVAERGGRVVLGCQPGLERVLKSLAGVDRVVSEGIPLENIDCHLPLMSLPKIFDTTLETIPADIPYLSAEADLSVAWDKRLGSRDGLKVGLVWRGNPQHAIDSDRSIPISALAPLINLTGINLFSFQKNLGKDGLPEGVTDLTPELDDYADTAAALSQMHLVITVDTSVAHLAGALGRPVWILLPYAADWRWLLERNDSPWYPQARLFRQKSQDDWEDVIERAAADLKKGF